MRAFFFHLGLQRGDLGPQALLFLPGLTLLRCRLGFLCRFLALVFHVESFALFPSLTSFSVQSSSRFSILSVVNWDAILSFVQPLPKFSLQKLQAAYYLLQDISRIVEDVTDKSPTNMTVHKGVRQVSCPRRAPRDELADTEGDDWCYTARIQHPL